MTSDIRPAATVIILREESSAHPPEILLLRRASNQRFAPGFWVFPGGVVEADDFAKDSTDERIAVKNAAIREAYEECSLQLSVERLQAYSFWLTPSVEPRRFATFFSIYLLEDEQDVCVDGKEIDAYEWISAKQALQRYANDELKLMPPTYTSLLELNEFSTYQEFLECVRSRELLEFRPKVIAANGALDFKNGEMEILLEGDAGYENEQLDAEGKRHRIQVKNRRYQYINTL